jgi:uncharacterized protein
MGWSFRKRIKIAPGLHINLSKSGISTSVGGRGFTYNSRGRVTTSLPGTGLRYTHNLNGRRTTNPNRAAVSASGRIDSASAVQLSKREQATRDFVRQVQNRTTKALQQYFVSHGVYVHTEDLPDATTLEDHQDFIESLSKDFEATTKAIRLGVDIGSISLAEKEKAMLAVYEIERKCSEAQGEKSELANAANSLREAISAWPTSPSFVGPFLIGLVACALLLFGFFSFGLVLLVATAIYGAYKLQSFEKKKTTASAAIETADARFGSFVETQISPLPDQPNPRDSALTQALGLAVVIAILAMCAAIYRPAAHATFSSGSANEPSTPAGNQATATEPARQAQASASQTTTYQPSFDCSKARSDAEHLICGDAELAADDVELASLHQQAKAQATDPAAFKEHVRQQWNYRERTCHDRDCLVQWYTDQKQWFTDVVNGQVGNASQPQISQPPSAPIYQTSFDCSEPTFLDQQSICHDPGLAAMDREMAAQYAVAIMRAADPAKLQADQNDWLAVRRDCASNLNCLRRTYGERIDQLRRS